MPREFECRREILLAATPEEVWDAVATAEGNAAWLFPNDIDAGAAKAWEPPAHLHIRQERGDWFNALEFTIEAREGGTTLMRYVHSGIFVDDWDAQYDGVSQHTDFYLHTLGQYLQYFDGRPVTYVAAEGPGSSKTPGAFDTVRRGLGVNGQGAVGDQVRLALPGLEPLDGVVDYTAPNFLGVRTADGLYRFYGRNAFGMPVGLAHHLFAPGVDREKTELAWRTWLDGRYA
jgi:hypothetical protein